MTSFKCRLRLSTVAWTRDIQFSMILLGLGYVDFEGISRLRIRPAHKKNLMGSIRMILVVNARDNHTLKFFISLSICCVARSIVMLELHVVYIHIAEF